MRLLQRLRLLLAAPGLVVLVGCSSWSTPLTGPAPSAAPPVITSPPATTSPVARDIWGYTSARLPTTIWLPTRQIPMDASFQWNFLYSRAERPQWLTEFSLAPVCGELLGDADQDTVNTWTTATSQVGPSFGGPGWLAGETILAAPDYSARSRQTLATLFHDLVAQAGTCPPAGSAVSVTVDNGTEYAATASVASNSGPPITLHEYLAMPAGYIEWFGVWYDPDNANGLPGTWSGPPARTLLSELESGPCSVSRRCG